jgi:hypothetical protein
MALCDTVHYWTAEIGSPGTQCFYAITDISRSSPPGPVRAHSTFFAKSNWLPRVPTVNLPRAHFPTGCPRVAAHLLCLRSVRRRTIETRRTPVPSGSDEALAQYSNSLNEPASINLLVTNIKTFGAQFKPP